MNGDVVNGDDAAFVEQPFLLGGANFVLEEGSSVDFDVHRSNPIFFHVVFRGAFLFKSGKVDDRNRQSRTENWRCFLSATGMQKSTTA